MTPRPGALRARARVVVGTERSPQVTQRYGLSESSILRGSLSLATVSPALHIRVRSQPTWRPVHVGAKPTVVFPSLTDFVGVCSTARILFWLLRIGLL